MTIPLRRMDPKTVTRDLFASLNSDSPPPLRRMSKKVVIDEANSLLVDQGGAPIARGSSFADTAAMISLQALSLGEGEDNEFPDWVLDGAYAHVSFVDGLARGWRDGMGEVTVTSLVGSDANVEEWWGGPTSYDPGKLTADGYVTGGAGEALSIIGDMRTLMNAGGTMLLRWKQVESSESSRTVVFVSADGNNAIEIGMFSDRSVEATGDGSLSISIPNILNEGAGAENGLAFTMVSDRLDMSVNGSDAETSALDAEDRPPGNPLVAWIIDTTDAALLSITVFEPLPSPPSEPDVPNTAPHDMHFVWYEYVPGTPAMDDTSVTVDQNYTGEFGGPLGIVPLVGEFAVQDDEGNPLTVSLSDDAGGAFEYSGDPPALNFAVNTNTLLGAYSVTVRVTDPGGLYVERELTITVTE